MSSHNVSQLNTRRQGILFKRRDVFRKAWRPRWFILEDAVLTYHLLSDNVGTHHDFSHDEEGVDFDVAPRGTIYLVGCEVKANERLTRPAENLFVFTITPPVNADIGPCFLATTTPESRDDWIQALSNAQEVDQDESVDSASVDPAAEQDEMPWSDFEPSSKVLAGVPRRIANRIQTALDNYMPLSGVNHGWKLFLDKDGVSAFERHGCTMIKTIAVIPFPPKQVFNLLIDHRRRRDFENNVRCDERLKRFSPYTSLDYYAYRAVWPTSARDFGVVCHWRVLTRDNDERAICILAFSDEAVDELRPPASDHVRADLKISMSLLRPSGNNQCHMTRILSYDLCGSLPKSLTSTILQQQATLPLMIKQHLSQTEPNPAESLTGGELSNEAIVKDVIDRLSETETTKDHGLLKKSDRGESLLLTEDTEAIPREEEELLPLTLAVILLLTPLVLWSFANALSLPGKEAYFVLAALLAVRAVVLSNLGPCYESSDLTLVGKVTCRFSVDLKGVLRFIANRKEEQEGEVNTSTEVSVIHIVIGAIAVAMEEVEPLKCKRIFIPLLGIDGYYYPRGGGVNISLLVPGEDRPDDIYTLAGVGSMSVQTIADRIVQEQDRIHEEKKATTNRFVEVAMWAGLVERPALGSCLVIASPDDSDHAEVDIDASPLHGSGVNVAVVVGGVRLVRDAKQAPSIKPPPRPTLSMSITIDCPVCNLAASRKFAERVQQLVQFPEMCED
jgi:hypothetical protein